MSRYIDKDKLLERMDDISAYYEEGREVKDEMIALVYDFLTADVEEVKHGEDIYYTVCDKHCEFKCSVCNAWIGVVEGGTLDAARGFYYCPHCGAKMDGGAKQC